MSSVTLSPQKNSATILPHELVKNQGRFAKVPIELIRELFKYLDFTSQLKFLQTTRTFTTCQILRTPVFSEQFPEEFLDICNKKNDNLDILAKWGRNTRHKFPASPDHIFLQTGTDPITGNPYVIFSFVGERECEVRIKNTDTFHKLDTWTGSIKIHLLKRGWLISMNESLPLANDILDTALKNPALLKIKAKEGINYRFSENDPADPETEKTKWKALECFLNLVVFQTRPQTE